MTEHGLPEGWTLKTERFDFGSKWGVAVTNNKVGAECRRNAVRAPGHLTEAEAIENALPALKQWMRENRLVTEWPMPVA